SPAQREAVSAVERVAIQSHIVTDVKPPAHKQLRVLGHPTGHVSLDPEHRSVVEAIDPTAEMEALTRMGVLAPLLVMPDSADVGLAAELDGDRSFDLSG